MSRKANFVLVMLAFIADIFVGYGWYFALFPMEPVTTIEATLGGAMMMFFTLAIIGLNAIIFLIALADD